MTTLDSPDLHTDVALLRKLCDTLVPAVGPGDGESAEIRGGLDWSAGELGLHEILPSVLAGLALHVRAAVDETLLAWRPAADSSLQEATLRWNEVAATPETAFGALVLRSTVSAMYYTLPDSEGRNPSWPVLGFDGPLLEPPTEQEFPKTLARVDVPPASVIHADVVVVGSGAGGGVAAARLAAGGRRVLVLERGTYRNEPDLPQLEALSFPNLYLDGGYVWSENGRLAMLAGATVGGGTTVNSMACLPTPRYVLDE